MIFQGNVITNIDICYNMDYFEYGDNNMNPKVDKQYYEHMNRCLYKAEKNRNSIEAEYCALHMLMAIENNVIDGKNTSFDTDPKDYQKMMSYVTKHMKRNKWFEIKTYLMSVFISAMIFYLIHVKMGINILASFMTLIVFLVVEFILDRAGMKKNLNDHEIKLFNKNVDPELIKYNIQILSN